MHSPPAHSSGNGGRGLEEPTAREVDVLALIGRGHSNTEIARELGIAGVTVKVTSGTSSCTVVTRVSDVAS